MNKNKFQLFHELYKNGIRFISPEDEKSPKNGIFRKDLPDGKIEGYTIEGFKKLVKHKRITFEGKPLTPKEVDIMFNFLIFERSIKS